MGLKEQLVAQLSCVFQFSAVQMFVGLRKEIMNNFVFSLLVFAAGFNNNCYLPYLITHFKPHSIVDWWRIPRN